MISLRDLTRKTALCVEDARLRLAAAHADDAVVRQLTKRRQAICSESALSWAHRLFHPGTVEKT